MVNRCHGYTCTNKKCRAKTKDNELFCCKSHEPINNDIIEKCFMCMDKINDTNEIIYFPCKHAFHKPCYEDWLNFSTYENNICIICRNEVFQPLNKDKNINTKIPTKQNKNLLKIKSILFY